MSTQSFKVKSGITLSPVDLTTLSNPQAGDLACDINDSNKIKRYDAATSAWAEVGSGGVGSLDILFAQDFESASLSTFSSPSGDQVGLVLDTVDPLHGKISAKLTHDASVNQFFKEVKAVDRKFRGQAIVMRLNVKSSASAGNVTISVYDETNAASLLSSTQLQLSNDVDGISNAVSFTIPSTSSSISYTITALPEAGSPVTFIDDIVAELSNVALLETSVTVPNITAWQGYTPTFQGFGSPTNIEFEWRQVGENVEIRGKFTSGTSTAVEARVGLPAGLTSAGTELIPSLQVAGFGGNSTNTSNIRVFLIEPSVTYMTIGIHTNGTPAGTITKVNGIDALASSATMAFKASVPCAGLSALSTKTIPLTQSGLVQEADSVLYAAGNAGQTITSVVTDIPFTFISNTGSDISFSGSTFSVNTDGVYSISGAIRQTVSGVQAIYLFDNGVATKIVGYDASSLIFPFALTTDLKAGRTYSIRAGTTATLFNSSEHSLTVTHQGSLKQVSVSSDQKITIPTSELRFEGSSSRGSTATAIVKFDTLAKIRGDAFTVTNTAADGTYITMTKAGKLDVSASLYKASAALSCAITRNQSDLTSILLSSSEYLAYSSNISAVNHTEFLSWSGFVKAGDIIRVAASSSAPTADNVNNLNLSFQEQDISVSVTNTLPQFSESDSSVRVDTANGYGSTGTKIRRFSNIRDNIGTDIEYADSATNGASFTVKSAGIYNISYCEQFSAAGIDFGISKNASSLTTNISSLTQTEILSLSNNAVASGRSECTWSGYLNEGDILRPHSEGSAAGNNNFIRFTMSKVGKPNVTGVDVTPFVNVQFDKGSIGEIKAFAGNVDGIHYLACDGSAVNRGTYAELFAAIGITHGQGDGSTTFNLPDYRGRFLRGVTGVSSNDPDAALRTAMNTGGNTGNNVGSVQTDTFASHTHNWTGATNDSYSGGTPLADIGSGTFATPGITLSSGGNETRPKNAYVNYGIRFKAANEAILAPTETFSTDTASLSYASSAAYTLSTLQNAPVGTFITFTYAANTNTRTQTTTAPTQSTADMNTNGILLYTRAYNAASTAANPAAVAIQIGKGLKGKSLDLYKSAGKVNSGSLDMYGAETTTYTLGVHLNTYNESTGILLVDAGYRYANAAVNCFLLYADGTTQTSGYLVINASKSPALTGVPLLQPRIATLSDVKASGTAGGTATAGSYQTRTLNTLSDPSGIVTSLASNQFVLPAGEYYIEVSAPAAAVGRHKIKIRNITDSTDSILGTAEFTAVAATYTTRAFLSGNIVISSSKSFELQHRVETTKTSDGFGVATSFGDSEVYSIVKITKVK